MLITFSRFHRVSKKKKKKPFVLVFSQLLEISELYRFMYY